MNICSSTRTIKIWNKFAMPVCKQWYIGFPITTSTLWYILKVDPLASFCQGGLLLYSPSAVWVVRLWLFFKLSKASLLDYWKTSGNWLELQTDFEQYLIYGIFQQNFNIVGNWLLLYYFIFWGNLRNFHSLWQHYFFKISGKYPKFTSFNRSLTNMFENFGYFPEI